MMVALALFAAVETDNVDAFLKELEAKREAIHVVQARMERENISPDGVFEAKGTLLYAHPRRIVFRYEDPAVTDLLIDNLRIYRYDEDMEQVLIDDLENDPATEAMYIGFERDVTRLQEAFDVTFFIPEVAEGAVKGLLLRPKRSENEDETGLTAAFEEVYLYLREKDYLPTRVIVVNDADSRVEMRMSDYRVNQEIDPAQTQFAIPEGTVIIENQESFVEAPEGGLLLPQEPIAPKVHLVEEEDLAE